MIGFNGTTEWALDSLDQDDALWLPAEHQLRDLLGGSFRRLERVPGGFTALVADASGADVGTTAAEPADAYALALLARLPTARRLPDTSVTGVVHRGMPFDTPDSAATNVSWSQREAGPASPQRSLRKCTVG